MRKKKPKEKKPEEINVRDLRLQAGLTQLEFAQRIGVTPITVSRWERGISKISKLALRSLKELDKE